MAALQTPWYDKAVEALKLNGKGERTQEAYARHVRKLIEFHHGKDPDLITEDEQSSAMKKLSMFSATLLPSTIMPIFRPFIPVACVCRRASFSRYRISTANANSSTSTAARAPKIAMCRCLTPPVTCYGITGKPTAIPG